MKKLLILTTLFFAITCTTLNAQEVTLETKITGLYVAFFNRAADEGGLTYWTNKGNNSSNQSNVLKELAEGFAQHASFDRAYGHLGNQSFVEAVYKNALGREGDTAGINYWTSRLNLSQNDPNYLSRSDFVSVFVEAALTFDRNDPQYAGLSEAVLDQAQLRHDLLANKAEAGLAFTHQLGTLSNVSEEHQSDPESDPAYLASIKIISEVTESSATVSTMLDFFESIKDTDNPIEAINVLDPMFIVKTWLAGKTFYTVDEADDGSKQLTKLTFNDNLMSLQAVSPQNTEEWDIEISGKTLIYSQHTDGSYTIISADSRDDYIMFTDYNDDGSLNGEGHRLYDDENRAEAYMNELNSLSMLKNLIAGETIFQHCQNETEEWITSLTFREDGNLATIDGNEVDTHPYRIEDNTVYMRNNNEERAYTLTESNADYIQFDNTENSIFYFDRTYANAMPTVTCIRSDVSNNTDPDISFSSEMKDIFQHYASTLVKAMSHIRLKEFLDTNTIYLSKRSGTFEIRGGSSSIGGKFILPSGTSINKNETLLTLTQRDKTIYTITYLGSYKIKNIFIKVHHEYSNETYISIMHPVTSNFNDILGNDYNDFEEMYKTLFE